MQKFSIQTIDELPKVAKELIANFSKKIILLKGNLGAGKTTLIKEIIHQFGSNDEVSSPTYSVVNEYQTDKGIVYHFDLYRMKTLSEVLDFGFDTYIDTENFCFIEWSEIVEKWLDLPYHTLTIQVENEIRTIQFN